MQRFISNISHQKICLFGRFIGDLFFFIDLRHRRIVRRNLRFCFPEWHWPLVLKTTRKVFQNFGITFLEIIQLFFSSREQVLAKVVGVEGGENLLSFHGDKAIFLISAHLGNWEMASLFASSSLKESIVAVAREIKNKKVEEWIMQLRTRFGGQLIKKKGALPEIRSAIRNHKVIAVLIDQGTKSGEGVQVYFFNKKVRAHSTVALLAMRNKVPVVPAFCIREENGFRVIIGDPLPFVRSGDLKEDIVANTQLMQDTIEQVIRQYPDQWFWFHKRFKIYYPQLYAEDMRRKQKQRKRKMQRMQRKQKNEYIGHR